jgi:hypothetical protein
VLTQTTVDDHRGNRTAATGIGSPARHPYIHANGNETRNAMTADAYIGDSSNAKSIWPSGRQLLNGATVVVDWILRKLSGGVWTVTDTTAAGSGAAAGALIVDGGIKAAKGIYIIKGDASAAGSFVDGSFSVQIAHGSQALQCLNDSDWVKLLDGTYTVNAAGDGDSGTGKINAAIGYYTNGTKVVGAQGSAVADATDATDVITQLNALLARLRTHGLIASS